MFRLWFLIGVLGAVWMFSGCGAPQVPVTPVTPKAELSLAEDEEQQPEEATDRELVKRVLSENGYRRKGIKTTVLVVNKQSRKLTLFYGTTPIRTYPVVLGHNPVDDKLCQGDMCTPEGIYHVVCKYPHDRWNKFILLDYPNTRNWLKFARAKKRGRLSPRANIGGEIGIHGTDDDLKNILGENWTLGCISLQNRHLDDIYPLINEDTLVVIRKR